MLIIYEFFVIYLLRASKLHILGKINPRHCTRLDGITDKERGISVLNLFDLRSIECNLARVYVYCTANTKDRANKADR